MEIQKFNSSEQIKDSQTPLCTQFPIGTIQISLFSQQSLAKCILNEFALQMLPWRLHFFDSFQMVKMSNEMMRVTEIVYEILMKNANFTELKSLVGNAGGIFIGKER
jgi:hypothetical protein